MGRKLILMRLSDDQLFTEWFNALEKVRRPGIRRTEEHKLMEYISEMQMQFRLRRIDI